MKTKIYTLKITATGNFTFLFLFLSPILKWINEFVVINIILFFNKD